MTPTIERISRSPAETFAIGRALGGDLRGGDFLALTGPLGAGKTQFIKGVAAGLGVPDDEPVVSPTFVLIREYAGRLTLYHIDAYRLSGAAELYELGIEELAAEPDAVVAIEWADRVAEVIPDTACRLELDHAGAQARSLRVYWNEPGRLADLTARLSTPTQ